MILGLVFGISGCYSIFQGGASGIVVDSESTTSPKTGIANVDIYAYTSEKDRNSDYSAWQEGNIFSPHAEGQNRYCQHHWEQLLFRWRHNVLSLFYLLA